MITFKCPRCSRSITVADEYAGKTGKCKPCGEPVRIPEISNFIPDDHVTVARSTPGAPSKPSKESKKKGVMYYVLYTILAAFFGYIFIMSFSKAGSNSSSGLGQAKVCTISLPNDDGDVIICTNSDALSEFTKYANASDKVGILEMLTSGRAFVVKSGTNALILAHGILSHEVRITDGQQAGRSGFVAREFAR